MNKCTANKFIEALAWFEAPVGKMDLLLSELEGEEREALKEKIGDLLKTHTEIVIEVSRKHPDLHPMGEGATLYKELKMKYEKQNT